MGTTMFSQGLGKEKIKKIHLSYSSSVMSIFPSSIKIILWELKCLAIDSPSFLKNIKSFQI